MFKNKKNETGHKAVLVMDMPSKCMECPCRCIEYNSRKVRFTCNALNEVLCLRKKDYDLNLIQKPENCPIRPIKVMIKPKEKKNKKEF